MPITAAQVDFTPEFTLAGGPTPAPWDDPTTWDTIFITGIPWQGKFEIKGAKRTYKWDVKPAPGIEGFNQTYRGQPHALFRIRFYLWTPSMYYYWITAIQPLFMYSGIKDLVLPVKVYHPSLANIGISACVCDSIGNIEKVNDELMFAVDVDLHEFLPTTVLNATSTPLAAIGINADVPGVPPASAAVLAGPLAAAAANQAAALGTAGGLP